MLYMLIYLNGTYISATVYQSFANKVFLVPMQVFNNNDLRLIPWRTLIWK